MKIVSLYDNGSETESEDKISISLPFVGIADATSEVYYPGKPPKKYDGLLAGQHIGNLFSQGIASAQHSEDVFAVATRINNAAHDFQISHRGNLEDSSEIGGVCFVIAKCSFENSAELVQAGDTLALWQHTDGRIGMTPNQVYQHDMKMIGTIEQLMKKHQGDRTKMWQEFGPEVLAPARREHTNISGEGGYGFLNGQLHAPNFWYQTHLKDVNLLLLLTDGMLEYEQTNNLAYTKMLLSTYQKQGINALLRKIRTYEKKRQKTSHITHAEAGVIAIEW